MNNEDGMLPYQSALAEIIAIVTVSHGLHIAFLVLGEDCPKLPDNLSSEKPPLNLNYSSLFKKLPRVEESVAAMPLFKWRDFRQDSPEFKKLSPSSLKSLECFAAEDGPYRGLVTALQDFGLVENFVSVSYFSPGPAMVMTFLKLDDAKFCPSVSRNDIEILAKAISDTHECNF